MTLVNFDEAMTSDAVFFDNTSLYNITFSVF